MPIEDVMTISGRGTVATGRVERGVAKVGDAMEIGVSDVDTIYRQIVYMVKEENMDFRMSVQIMNVRCHRTVWTEVIMLNAKAERPV